MFNYNESTDLMHSLILILLILFGISLAVIGLLKLKIIGNSKRSYYIIAGLVVIFDLFYVFNRNPSIDLMQSLQLVILNLFGIALGVIGLLKIKITGNGKRSYYVIG
ncbi:MAG: hypothetical protein ACI8WT_004425 [Clostridium sp.]|jgi:uncharacterized protein YebE (UPF0316 family)